ncbi:MAG: hypothetical protein KDD59_05750 [Bdellovibrionales bacterium]|nr:hypothetical protein [Bdellovibrionales bacterium]
MGPGKKGDWEKNFLKTVHEMLEMDRPQMEKFLSTGHSEVELLNYILSSSMLTPGFTDRSMVPELMQRVPYEPWMIDEFQAITQLSADTPQWLHEMVDEIDQNPPPGGRVDDTELAKRVFSDLGRVFFSFGENDNAVPAEESMAVARKMNVP